MTTIRALVVACIAVLLVSCGSDATTTATAFTTPQRNPTVTYDSGIGWSLDVFDETNCLRARFQALATPCVSTEWKDGTHGLTSYEGGGTRLVMLVLGTSDHVSGEWASKREQLQKPFVEVAPGVQVGVFPIDGDDTPVQVRVLDPDGSLRETYSLDQL